MLFPEGFLWGSATAALQIEGAVDADGRGTSMWEDFCDRFPERIYQQATPTLACDHYHRYGEDLDWIARLNHNSYRFSIAWPRVVPQGRGAINRAGLDFYERLVDGLLERGVTPNATLYHWDLPLALAEQQGWENPATVEAFLEYAQVCMECLADRIKLWATINEPAWVVLNGYLTGLHPPAKQDRKAAVLAAHHLLCAHTEIASRHPAGIALNLSPVLAASESPEDQKAAELADGVLNRWFLEPVLRGRYPADMQQIYDAHGLMPESPFELTPCRPSFLGINYYYPHHARSGATSTAFHINNSGRADEACKFSLEGCFELIKNPRGRYTDWAWEIDPSALTQLLLRLHREAPDIDLYVTENGIGLPDQPNGDDQDRIDFVTSHLQAIHKAIGQGCPVKGYYMWSLMDNFSWINGYKKRYGFLYIDRQTMQRSPKKSAHWFAQVAADNGLL